MSTLKRYESYYKVFLPSDTPSPTNIKIARQTLKEKCDIPYMFSAAEFDMHNQLFEKAWSEQNKVLWSKTVELPEAKIVKLEEYQAAVVRVYRDKEKYFWRIKSTTGNTVHVRHTEDETYLIVRGKKGDENDKVIIQQYTKDKALPAGPKYYVTLTWRPDK